jgi:glutaconate CoA-transferase subunit B
MHISFEEIGGRGIGRAYEIQELMAVLMSRQLRDNELVGTGAGSAMARAACRLAQLLHAPGLSYLAGGSGAVNPYLEPLVASSCDYANLLCESTLHLAELISAIPAGRVDVFFYGALQVDRYGNVNLSVVGDPTRPRFRGPGAVALPLLGAARRGIIFMTDHSPRSFVEKISFLTAPGFLDGPESWEKARADGQIRGDGPALVITPLAVLDFEETTRRMRLVSVHPGVTVEQVQAATGFELILPAEVPTTTPPDPTEIRLLREIDETWLLRQPLN